jgi:membrane-associated protease RseP (regulator of RpoE activity)
MLGSVPQAGDAKAPGSSDRDAFIRLLVVLAGAVGIAIALHGLAVLVVVLALVAMVMLHELGHFVVAKVSGMKVTEYFLGFGPRIWSIRRGETEYGVKAIPAGGYVRIVGMTMLEDVDPADEARSYRQASFPRRLGVAVAGSTMHFIIAFVLLWVMFFSSGAPTGGAIPEVSGISSFSNVTSPAKAAGLKVGDKIISVNGHSFANGDDYVTYVRNHPSAELTLVVRRGDRDLSLEIHTINAQHALGASGKPVLQVNKPTGIIGVQLDMLTRYDKTNPISALARAGSMLGSLTKQTGLGIGQVFSLSGLHSIAHQVATATNKGANAHAGASGNSGEILSIYGAGRIAAQAASQNVSELLLILVLINIFIGMVNLFPMLPLDGGHVVIALYERLRSRRGHAYHADVRKLMPVAYAFLAGIVLIGLSALYINILNPPSLPGG